MKVLIGAATKSPAKPHASLPPCQSHRSADARSSSACAARTGRLIAGPAPALGLRRSVDGHRRRQYRDLDAERSRVLVDDRPRFQPAYGGAGPGGDHIADVRVRPAGRRPGRHRRSPPPAAGHPDCSDVMGRGLRPAGVVRPRNASHPARIHFYCRDLCVPGSAGVAVDRAEPRAPARAASRGRAQQRRDQYQPRGRAGARRVDHRGSGNGGPVLDECDRHHRRDRCADVVAPSARRRSTPSPRAFQQRDPRWPASCASQSALTRDPDPRRGVLCVRQRLLGLAAAGGA